MVQLWFSVGLALVQFGCSCVWPAFIGHCTLDVRLLDPGRGPSHSDALQQPHHARLRPLCHTVDTGRD